MTLESLRSLSHVLLWLSIMFPLMGGLCAAARYYVHRKAAGLAAARQERAVGEIRSATDQARSSAQRLAGELEEAQRRQAESEAAAREKIVALERAAQEANDAAKAAQAEADGLRPRRVTPDQENSLRRALTQARLTNPQLIRPTTGISVTYQTDDSEAAWLAGELHRILESSGWQNALVGLMGHSTARGLYINVGQRSVPQAHPAIVLGEALSSVGIKATIGYVEGEPADGFSVFVAAK